MSWGSTRDACWRCLCAQCGSALDQCGPDCVNVLGCTVDKHALVDVAADLACEVRATVALCLTDQKSQAAATAVVNLDTCLVARAAQAGDGHFRACESECGVVYSGDVCERFPN